VAATLTLGGNTGTAARIAFGGVAPTLLRVTAAETAIMGHAVNDADVAAAVSNAVPMTMNKYRVFVAQALTKRAVLS